MSGDELGHGKGSHSVVAKDFGHFLIWEKVLLVLRVLEVVILYVGPEVLDTLPAGSDAHPNDVGQVAGDSHGLAEWLRQWRKRGWRPLWHRNSRSRGLRLGSNNCSRRSGYCSNT